MKRFLLLLALATCAPLAMATDDISKVNGSIHTDAGASYRDLDTVNGSIHLASGTRARGVETVNGSINAGDNVQARNMETVNGAIRGGRGLVLGGDVETVNGSIFIDHGSRIDGGVETVNGGIGLVGTEVGQNVETVNGDITIGIGSHVKGAVKVNKSSYNLSLTPPRTPRIDIGPRAGVDGPLTFEREVSLYVHATATIGNVSGASVQRFDTDVAPKE